MTMQAIATAQTTGRRRLFATLGSACLALLGATACAQRGGDARAPRVHAGATSASVQAFVAARGLRVLTFVGYSGAGYENPAAMLAQADQVLAAQDPAQFMVNIGATAEGIGAVYALARRRGFATLGIVSSLAQKEQVPLSPDVDHVFFVEDSSWGGKLPGSEALAPVSAAIVANSSLVVGIGGGDIARDEMLAARAAGKPVRFIAADMQHAAALRKARERGQPAPTDFRGSAHVALGGGA